jgi:hypothetical protein
MVITEANPEERIARERLTQRPLFLGVDSNGATHYWDSYEYAVVVGDEEPESEKFEYAATPCQTLADWCVHIRRKRGWEIGPNVGSSMVTDLVRAVKA